MPLDQIDRQWFVDVGEALEYVSLIDANDNLLYVNQVDVIEDSLAGRSVYDFVEPKYHSVLRRSVAAARETGTPQHYNSYAQNREGARSLYSNWVVAMTAASLEGTIAFIATDVTELTRVEQELQLSDSTLQSLVANSPDTMFIVDQNRILVFASKFDYGFDSSLVLGVSADLFLPEAERASAIATFEEVLAKGVVAHFETTVETPEGARCFSARMAPIRNHDQIDRVMIVVTDVTERRAAEAEQKRLQQQLSQAQKMEAIGQLTGGIAHDFNNLLLTIGGNLELAESCQQDPRQAQKYIEGALLGVQRGRELNQRLLAFSRRQPLSPEALDIGALVSSLDILLRRTLGENIQVHVDAGNAKGHVSRVDRAQLENAVLNLALNARDAMPNGGDLTISANWIPAEEFSETERLPGLIRLNIRDSGKGMSEEVQALAIEPFFTTKQVGDGSGLGLSMVYGFVQQSGGQFRIRSELGQGTEVEIELPCVEETVLAVEINEDQLVIPRGNGELVLLVEDQRSVREIGAKMLEALGYQTLTAADSEAALTLLGARKDIALVITDIVMPGAMNGYDLANRCREVRPELPIMLVSGHPLDPCVSSQSEQWMDSLLQKPYQLSELAQFVSGKLSASPLSKKLGT